MRTILTRWIRRPDSDLPGLSRSGCRDSIWRDQGGSTAIEFALVAGTLVLLLLNGVDLGRYVYLRERVENAAQAGAHAVWKKCDPTKLPVASKCPEWDAAATAAVFRTLLNKDTDAADDGVTLQKPLVEGYFCPDSTGALHPVPNPASPPAQCLSGIVPGDYIQLRVTSSYRPLFGDLSVTRLLGTSITMTSYMRLQ
jgi:Flp pilus assembly pilin Flp